VKLHAFSAAGFAPSQRTLDSRQESGLGVGADGAQRPSSPVGPGGRHVVMLRGPLTFDSFDLIHA
jgi:hypothetical protein